MALSMPTSDDPASESGRTITRLLDRWRDGDGGALDDLLPLVYDELRRVAARHRGAGETLRPTALVHEAFLRFQRHGGPYEDRVHFFAAAASTMRRLLIDHVRTKQRRKRGGGAVHVELDPALVADRGGDAEVLALDRALEELTALDPRKARVVELHFFGGLNYDEVARTLDLSPATVGRELRFARAWLRTAMARGGPERAAEGDAAEEG
jgi:RNA polymerase sigma factor (TIGR02999 family)